MDRNKVDLLKQSAVVLSLSARRAWIEIADIACGDRHKLVALRKESVDRNTGDSVLRIFTDGVALRKESVDRNGGYNDNNYSGNTSLSARRAWIEIPHAEYSGSTLLASLSARRAWIEINDPVSAGASHGGRSPQGERG